jgi:hypothetical protein
LSGFNELDLAASGFPHDHLFETLFDLPLCALLALDADFGPSLSLIGQFSLLV